MASRIAAEGDAATIDVTLLTVDTAAYAVDDFIGKHTAKYLTFANVAEIGGGRAILQDLIATDDSGTATSLELWLFSAAPDVSSLSDNGAFAVAAADCATLLGIVDIVSWRDGGTPGAAHERNLAMVLTCADGSKDIYGLLVTRAAVDFVAATGLNLRLKVLR